MSQLGRRAILQHRPLGRTGLVASLLGFGCSRIAESHRPADRREVEATLCEVLIHPLATIDLDRLAAVTRPRGVAVVARQALDKGALLTHSVFSQAASNPVRAPAQTLLRYAAQGAGVDAVLVGMRSRAHLRENVAGFASPGLSADELRQLRSLSAVRG